MIELSRENATLLESLQNKDIESLIRSHHELLRFEVTLLLLLATIAIALAIYYLLPKWTIKKEKGWEARLQKMPLTNQKQFLNDAERFIRDLLVDKGMAVDGLTDLELFAYFHNTPLHKQSEEALSLIDQGRYSQTPLKEGEIAKIRSFLFDLYREK